MNHNPTTQDLLSALRLVVEGWEPLGDADNYLGTIHRGAVEHAQRVLLSFESPNVSESNEPSTDPTDDARFVDPFEIVVGEDPGPLNLASLASLSNDPVDW